MDARIACAGGPLVNAADVGYGWEPDLGDGTSKASVPRHADGNGASLPMPPSPGRVRCGNLTPAAASDE